MILLEYEAKSLLKASGIPVPNSSTLPVNKTPSLPIDLPVVIKSQVPVGGRGKLGGVKLAQTDSEFHQHFTSIATQTIKGFTPSTLLIEEALAIKNEYYISLRIDRSTESIELLAHATGGIEVEENRADSFLRIQLRGSPTLTQGDELAEFLNLNSHTFALQDLLANLYSCFVNNDATLIEINPLILTEQDTLIAGDCKMTLDDAATFRHPEWDFETPVHEANFVTLDEKGNVATIANGAGLAMATVDAVSAAGLTPANFLDIGGGASAETVLEAFKTITTYNNVRAIVINIFAGITRCDEVAKAIISAKKQLKTLPALYIRLAGTNYNEAKILLDAESITLLSTLADCIEAAKQEVQNA